MKQNLKKAGKVRDEAIASPNSLIMDSSARETNNMGNRDIRPEWVPSAYNEDSSKAEKTK